MDGVTVGGRKLSDQQQVKNLAEAAKELFVLVKANQFSVDKCVSDDLHRLVATGEALEAGHFRGEGEVIDLDTKRLSWREGPLHAASHTGMRTRTQSRLYKWCCNSFFRSFGRAGARHGIFSVWCVTAILF